MPRFDASFVGLTVLDISGRPIRGIPEGGNVEFIEEIRLNPAGTASGALMIASKLGLHCRAVACVGNDEKGDFIIDYYRRIGERDADADAGVGRIDVEKVYRCATSPTSATILPIRPNGDRPALHARGASDRLFVPDSDFEEVCDARFLHHGGTGLLADMDQGQSARLLSYAKSSGLTTTLDLIAPNESTLDVLKPLLPHVDYFMPSMEEALLLSHCDTPEEAARYFLDLGVAKGCIFKWGPRGSFIKTAGESGREFRVPAYRVEVLDTTGCGDAYCGGFIAGLNRGMDVKEACRLGTAASGLVATGLGSDFGVKNFESTRRFMQNAEVVD